MDRAIIIALSFLSIMTLGELFYFRKMFGKVTSLYITAVMLLFISVAFEHTSPVMKWGVLVFSVVVTAFKLVVLIHHKDKLDEPPEGWMLNVFALRGWMEYNNTKKVARGHTSDDRYNELLLEYTVNMNGQLVIGYDGLIRHVNKQFCDHVGLQREELIGKPYQRFMSEHQLKRSQDAPGS
jgi:PAS domain-containing protein